MLFALLLQLILTCLCMVLWKFRYGSMENIRDLEEIWVGISCVWPFGQKNIWKKIDVYPSQVEMDACPRRHSQEAKALIPPAHNKRVFRKPRTAAKLLQEPPSHSQHDSATNSPPFPSSFPKSARSSLIPNLTASPIYVGCDVENIDVVQIWHRGHTIHSIGDGTCTMTCGWGGAETHMQVRS